MECMVGVRGPPCKGGVGLRWRLCAEGGLEVEDGPGRQRPEGDRREDDHH